MDDTIAGTGEVESARILAAAGTGTWWGKTAVEVRSGEEGGIVNAKPALSLSFSLLRD